MADYRAISVVCEAIMMLLRANYKPELFNNQRLEFKISLTSDLINRSKNKTAGVSLFLFQLHHNAFARNTPPSPIDERGIRRPKLQLDLHFLLTAWARDARTQHEILGWMMRVLEDNPILPATLLNNVIPGSYQADEAVQIIPLELSNEELLHIWEGSVNSTYRLSIPYIARNVGIETLLPTQSRNDPN